MSAGSGMEMDSMKMLFPCALLTMLVVSGTVYAQTGKQAPKAQPPYAPSIEAATKEMEALMASLRVPFPKTDAPDEAKPICVNGRRALAVRYGAYGSIMWDITPQGHTVPC